MCLKLTKLVIVVAAISQIIALYCLFRLFFTFTKTVDVPNPTKKTPIPQIQNLISIVIRDFELNQNEVRSTVHFFLKIFPSIPIFILYDSKPYPTLGLDYGNNSLKSVREINLTPSLRVAFYERNPLLQINTKYILFVPDSTRAVKHVVQKMVAEIVKQPGFMIVAPVGKKPLKCLVSNVKIKEWTLKYDLGKDGYCDEVTGKHVMLLEKTLLETIADGFLLPFPHSLYVQTAAQDIKLKVMQDVSFNEGKLILNSHHNQWKLRQREHGRLKELYRMLKIKLVVRDYGPLEWYGCTKETPRCFDTVLDSTPSYLLENRWTPPCCLANLKRTAKHVISHLEETGIRFWLEAGSLLGAMRSGDILPWDHDVDIGFHREDLHRSHWLTKARDRPIVDEDGFYWEKATEGNFYRINYSKTNKIYVNLFPFYLKNGTVTKDAWYTSHKHMDFPEHFLHPMSSIEFMGRKVPSPNNIRDFLEMKYWKGAIENPQYPNPSMLPFP